MEIIRVLCIDDEIHDRALIRHALEKESRGFVMVEADSRESFAQFLIEADFDVVLSDFNILGFEGLEVIREVKKRRPEVPVIVVTGTGSEEIAVKALKQGADDYVIKSPQHIAQLPHTIRQVLEARKTRERLRESEEKYRSMMEAMREPTYICSPDFRVGYMNPAMIERVGRDATGELCYQAINALPERCPWCSYEQVKQGLPSIDEVLSPLDNRNFLVSSSPIFHPDGTISKMTIYRDITEYKKVEEERKNLQTQLLQAQKMDAIGRLAGGVAHDFNNMLTIILGHGEALLDELQPEDPLREDVVQILEAGRRSAALTRQLLVFSRKQTQQLKVLSLNDLISNLNKMLQRLIGENIAVELLLEEGLAPVKADPGQLEQVIVNLAVNARDAMPEGGRLIIETANVELDDLYCKRHAKMIPAGCYVRLSLTDTGCGMDQDTQAKIFEPFFTLKKQGEGTGLGLATVYGIVKQSGGYIWVYSEPEHGSTFKIYFPRVESELENGSQPVASVTVQNGSGEHILVVEDEKELRRMAEKVLSRLGYRVSVAADGSAAIGLVEEGLQPDLLLTDVIMPGLAGPEVANTIRRRLPQLKVLYMSGYTGNAVAHYGVLDQNRTFLQKPFSAHELAAKVQQVLGGRLLVN
ncbi:MAG: response regulator [Deltaproteobacteria bacterium]|nr:response regulator [Deltaproteobacteria bacterium]